MRGMNLGNETEVTTQGNGKEPIIPNPTPHPSYIPHFSNDTNVHNLSLSCTTKIMALTLYLYNFVFQGVHVFHRIFQIPKNISINSKKNNRLGGPVDNTPSTD